MKRNRRLVVVLALVGSLFLVLSPFSAQLAVSSEEDSAADASNFSLSDKDDLDDARHNFEEAVLREERPGVSAAQGHRSGTRSSMTAEEHMHENSPSKRQWRSSSRSSIQWHLPRRGSQTRPYRSVSKPLGAVISMAAAIFVLWRFWNAVLRCLEQNHYTSRTDGTTPRLLSDSQASAVSLSECLKTEGERSLSTGDLVKEHEVVDRAGGGNFAEEDDDVEEAEKPVKTGGEGETGSVAAQKQRRRSLLAAFRVLVRVVSAFIIAGGIIGTMVLQSATDAPEARPDAVTPKEVMSLTLLSGGVLGVFSDFFPRRSGTRGLLLVHP